MEWNVEGKERKSREKLEEATDGIFLSLPFTFFLSLVFLY